MIAVRLLIAASDAEALTKCKATVGRSDGAVLVQARGASGPLQWGTDPSSIDRSFFECQGNAASPRNCTFGPPDTLSRQTPPALCRVFLSDGVSADCSAVVRFCSPGWRIRDDSFDANDPRVEAFTLETNSPTDVVLTGFNLRIVDGSGDTGGAVTGLGNLIVGYNEDSVGSANDRTGSHNLIVGGEHAFSSYAGVVFGRGNTVSGKYASVSAGLGNVASGDYSSVSGGGGVFFYYGFYSGNRASGSRASVSGGHSNTASGSRSSVSGGGNNTASSSTTSVSGGFQNTASGSRSSVSGGFNNTATAGGWVGGGLYASVSGGRRNKASGDYASASGGKYNTASGKYASVSGGRNNFADENYSTVSGGNGYNTTVTDDHLP